MVFPGWAFDAETVVNTHRLLRYRCYHRVTEGLERQVPGTALAATPPRLLPENVDPMPGPLGDTERSSPPQSGGGGRLRGRLSDQDGVRWRVAGRYFGQMRPIRSSLSVSPLCKETIRWMHDPGVLAVRGVTCQRRGVRGDRRPVGSDLGPAGRGGHP